MRPASGRVVHTRLSNSAWLLPFLYSFSSNHFCRLATQVLATTSGWVRLWKGAKTAAGGAALTAMGVGCWCFESCWTSVKNTEARDQDGSKRDENPPKIVWARSWPDDSSITKSTACKYCRCQTRTAEGTGFLGSTATR